MKILRKSIFWQVLFVLCVGFFVLQFVSALHLIRTSNYYISNLIVNDRAKNIATSSSLINMTSKLFRYRIIDNLKTNNLRLVNISEQPDLVQGTDPTSLLFKEQVTLLLQGLSADAPMPYKDHEYTIITNVSANLNPFSKVMLANTDYKNGVLSQAAVQLYDGSWLYFSDVSPLINFQPESPLLFLFTATMISLCICFLVVIVIVKPLKKLSEAARFFGANLKNPVYIAESGPAEVQAVLHSYNLMQKQIGEFIEERDRTYIAVSHDIRTPLTRLRLRVENLDEDLRYSIIQDISEIEDLIQTTYTLTKQDRLEESFALLDLVSLVESMVYDRQDLGVDVKLLDIDQDVPAIKVRQLCLKRCLNNLIDNALRYAGQAEVGIEQTDDEVIVLVCDRGPGIAEDYLTKVFKPFFRVDASRNKSIGGLGLGLTIANNMAELNKARIELFNRSGGGLCAKLIISKNIEIV